jgi:hypothetical protein
MYPHHPESPKFCQSLISAKACDIGNPELGKAPMKIQRSKTDKRTGPAWGAHATTVRHLRLQLSRPQAGKLNVIRHMPF